MKNRFIAIFLAAVLCTALWPAAAFAEESQSVTVVPGKGLALAVEGGNVYFDNGTGTITECDPGVTGASIPASISGTAVVKIGDSAFSGNRNLKTVSLPEGLKTIGKEAFASCTGLGEIRIPGSVDTIGSKAFESCSGLTGITVAQENLYYSSREGVLFDKDETSLLVYPAGKADSSYRIPEGVTRIGSRSFAFTENLKTLYLPDSMDTLDDRDLEDAIGLKKVVFPDELMVIGDEAFLGCISMTDLSIASGAVSIGDRALKGCTKLKKVTFPSTMVVLGDDLFDGCTALESIGVASANKRFASRDGVLYNKSVTQLILYPPAAPGTVYKMPDTVKEVKDSAFKGVTTLKSLILSSGMKTVPADSFTGMNTLTEVTFPQGVERIDAFAFSECANLEQIMLTAGLSLVDKSAFADCPKLKDVYFSGTQAQWNSACKWPAGQPYASIRIHCGTVPGLPATDVEQGRWSAGDITYAYQNGLMKGTGPGMFEPTTRTTRGMIVTILHRIEQQPSASQAVSFWDVAAGSYYYEAVRWAASEGIVNGTGDGAFQPDSGITREQLAVILYRYAVYNGQAGSGDASAVNRYGDAYAVSDYAREALGWAITTGLINGNGGLLEPKTVATREQVAAILHRFCTL
ncbi:MAG: leucine-rich repeat protein [Firmicutes bacterium]|nr:leucine-rich repeat protein [Bacillota bacterium]